MPNYNVAVYEYPTFTQARIYSRPIKILSEVEKNHLREEKEKIKNDSNVKETNLEKDTERILYESCRRSKDNLYNVINSNKWEYFITLTFDRNGTKTGKPIDSSNYDLVYKKLNTFLKNFKYRNSSHLQYVIVPELHEDKIHYHFHGLLSNCDELHFEDSGKKTPTGDTIFNITNWSYGFTTATRVKDNDRVCSYIAKYISKDNLIKVPNRNRYLASRGLNRVKAKKLNTFTQEYLKNITKKQNITYVKTVTCKVANRKIKYIKFKKNG